MVAVVGHEAERVEEELTGSLDEAEAASVSFALQAEQKGTGHAVQCALDALGDADGTVLILYGDTPLLRDADLASVCALRKEKNAKLALLVATVDDPTGYGRILRNGEGVVGIVEHKDATAEQRDICEMNPGIYAVEASFLREALTALAPNNEQGEYYLTDLVEMAAKADGSCPSIEVAPEDILGVNDRSQLADATQILRSRINVAHMKAGVTMEDPASVRIDAGVKLGRDVVLAANVSLCGKTSLADDVQVREGCVVTDCAIGAGTTLHPYSVCQEAVVGKNASVGPFARLRPLARLDDKVRVGNFVEVKKAHLHEGAKANHLAYLGDADIGAGSNVGAGTITCNYDGAGKHLTTLGERVFIGSNSTLVAPVTIASDAYVAAGSTIGRDVPSDALAISRTRQENKEGYAARIRKRNEARKAKQKAEAAAKG